MAEASRPLHGIWLNKDNNTVLRVNSPYWKDEVAKDNWVFITDEVNATLLAIRDLAVEQGHVDDPLQVNWR
jgi:hypothetical protein